ncbi:MAG: Gfo/Idh/MocA family oxidoreductase [Planctomycetota bacterium]|nr:Gfo/Idh/MocA family oxidoreductase [Planctomycetota bacterium]
MSKVKLAVIGAGRQCTKSLMPGIPYIETLDLVAVCDLQQELAERNARNFGARAAYTDIEKMLAEARPEACMVVGPPQMHLDIGLRVLEAGCHLFVEKPTAPTVEGARKLAELSVKKGLVGQVGHMMRHAGPVRIAEELSKSEGFGKLLSVESKYTTWPTGALPADSGWGNSDEDWSYMLVQGGHPIDLLRHFLGEVARVSAFRCHGQKNAKVYQATLEGQDGRVGFLNLQDSFNGWYTGLELVGDGKAVVRVDDLGRVTYRTGKRMNEAARAFWGNDTQVWEPHHTLSAWERTGYGNQLRHFADCILNKKAPYPSLVDGWKNLVVARAILDSIAQRKTIEAPQETLAV